MNSEIIYNKINNLENKVVLLYKNKNLNSSILHHFNDLEKYIKEQNRRDENNPIFNTFLKNLDLFKERTLLKIEEIDLENKLNVTNTPSVSSSDKISILSYEPKKYKEISKISDNKSSIQSSKQSSIQSSIITSDKSSSSQQYLIYILVFIVVVILIFFILKGMF